PTPPGRVQGEERTPHEVESRGGLPSLNSTRAVTPGEPAGQTRTAAVERRRPSATPETPSTAMAPSTARASHSTCPEPSLPREVRPAVAQLSGERLAAICQPAATSEWDTDFHTQPTRPICARPSTPATIPPGTGPKRLSITRVA